MKRRGEDEEVELVSDSEEEEEDDDDDEQLEKGKEKESNSSSSSNTTLDVSDVPLIATATYFGRARQQEGVTTMTTITIDDEEFLPTIAIDCVSSEESCGDFSWYPPPEKVRLQCKESADLEIAARWQSRATFQIT